MKTKVDFWEAHCKKHPAFRNEDAKIKLRVGELHRMLDEAYSAGVQEMASVVQKMDEVKQAMRKAAGGGDSIFDDPSGILDSIASLRKSS